MNGVKSLTDVEVRAEMDDVRERFHRRHRDLDRMLELNFARVERLLHDVSTQRRLLVGALLTQEYAFQAAAVTNPSVVPAPDQTGIDAGALRFVMSLRAIGEGPHLLDRLSHRRGGQ